MSPLRGHHCSDAAHNAVAGAAGGLIGFVETVESDMTKTLAVFTKEEEAAAAEYDRVSKENEIGKPRRGKMLHIR